MTPPSSAEPPAAGTATAALETTVTWLEMTAPPARALAPAPAAGVEVRHARAPTVSFYRYLYDAVGAPWAWFERKALSDAQLATIIADPAVEVHVLWVDGTPAGYVELDRRRPPDIELAYFGLIPEFIGRGLGRHLLDWAVFHAWSAGPGRLWVHTCDLDHPRALPLYQSVGFRIYRERRQRVVMPGADAGD